MFEIENFFDYFKIDDVIYGWLWFGIMVYLLIVSLVIFGELKEKVGVMDGNLLMYLRKLEEVGYVE